MSVDWDTVAAEVADGLRSVGSTDAGLSAVLRQSAQESGRAHDPQRGVPSYYDIQVVDTTTRIGRDADGRQETVRRLLVAPDAPVVPRQRDMVLVGKSITDVTTDDQDWVMVTDVVPLQPGGTTVLYEVFLER